MNFRNRVIEVKQMSIVELMANENNWREHPDTQRKVMRTILEEIGIAGTLLAYYSDRNDGKLTMIDGHLRKELGEKEVWPVCITDLNDKEADSLLTLYDSVGAMSTTNRDKLRAIIENRKDENEKLKSAFDAIREKEMLPVIDHVRPDFTEIIDRFDHKQGISTKDENWFYVEFYGEDSRFKRLADLFVSRDAISGKHEINRELFENAFLSFFEGDGAK
jgi:hypothetical protein